MNIDTTMTASHTNRLEQLSAKSQRVADDKKLMETCKEFEAIFIKQMLDSMKSTVSKSGLIKENMGEKIFDDMLYDEYAQKMSATSQFGISDMMYRQLSKYNSN